MKNIKQYLIWFTGLQVIHFSILTYWILSGISAIYGTNDDSLMSSISSGTITGNIDKHLIFIEPIFSIIIKYLEILLPNYSGYTFFLIFIATSSYVSVLTTVIILKKVNIYFIVIYLFAFISLISWFAINPTYTGASLFAAGAAATHINLLFLNQVKIEQFMKLILIIFSIFCFISYAIRNEGLYIAAVLSIPGLISVIKNLSLVKKFIKFSLLPFLLLYSINLLLNFQVYTSEWKPYLEMNELRHQIQLREPERRLKNQLTEINWNESTYYMFTKFILVDETKLNKTNMQKIINVTKTSYIKDFKFDKTVLEIKNKFQLWTWILKYLIFLIFFSVLLNRNMKDIKILLLYLIILSFSGLILLLNLGSYYQLPERISFNFLCALTLTLLITLLGNMNERIKRFNYIFIVILFLGTYDYFGRFNTELVARQNAYQTRLVYANNQKKSFSNLNSELIVSGASSVKSDWQNPYYKFQPIDPRNKTVILGWHNLSPIWLKQVNKLFPQSKDFYSNLLDSNVYWIDSPEEIENTKKFFEVHLKVKVKFSAVREIGNSEYYLFKFYQ